MRYFDAGALAKRYVREKGTLKVQRLLSKGIPATSRLSAVELVSALMRRLREGTLSEEECDRALAGLESDITAMLLVEFTPEVVVRAQLLLRRHRLRAGDAIQLASSLHLQDALEAEVTFVAFDERLMTAARLEGLKVV
jgi:uncharacterized protein